jgi:hypothetical protein
MPAPTHELLCESCGYPVDDLPRSGQCPECGRSVASSLPEARTGSPWQQRPSLRTFISTNVAALRRPGPLFESLLIEFRRGTGLLVLNLLIAAVGFVAPWYGTLIGDPTRRARLAHRHEYLTAAWVIPLQILIVAVLLTFLTLIEWAGVQYYARRRKQRLYAAAAWQVCAHASIGWVLSAGFTFLAFLLWSGISDMVSGTGQFGRWLLVGVPGLGAFAGFMAFESLVYLGVRRCRFANRPPPPA